MAIIIRGVADVPGLKDLTDDEEPLYKRSLEIREKALGPNHYNVAMSLYSLAQLYQSQGMYYKAESLYKSVT